MCTMRTFKCIVPGCEKINKENPALGFFSLPLPVPAFEEWVKNLHLTKFLADKSQAQRNHLRICGLHFDDICFQTPEKKKLNRGAIPTIIHINDDTVTEPLPDPSMDLTLVNMTSEPMEQTIAPKNMPGFFTDIFIHEVTVQTSSDTDLPGTSTDVIIHEMEQTSSSTNVPSVQVPLPVAQSPYGNTRGIYTGLRPASSRNVKGKRTYSRFEQMRETRVADLRPRKRKVYGELVKARHVVSNMKRRGVKSLEKVFSCMDIATAEIFREFKDISRTPSVMQMFVRCMVRNYWKIPKSRRYSPREKSFFVGLLKSSPRGYYHLAKFLPMPSKRTLCKSVPNVELRPGINNKLFSYLNTASTDLDPLDRHCVLLFGEVALGPQRSEKGYDQSEGSEEISGERCYKLADYALVFMIRGLSKSWNQPLAFFLVQSTAKTYSLKACIQQVVRAVHERTKFVIVASVSDTGASNRGAVNSLGKDYIYNVNGHKIIHLFDAPHLIKSVRNSFMAKNIVYAEGKTAKWEHIKSLYNIDGTTEDSKVTKLTNNHIYPEGENKMDVTLAVQVLSRSVYAILTMLSKIGYLEAQDTADFCLFMNNLFDSLNSTLVSSRSYACRVDDNSVHLRFWTVARKTLDGIVFIGHKPGSVPPCIDFFKVTIINMEMLWKTLKDIGFKYLLTKSVNQDPLESFFADIRRLCGQDDNPTCSQFVAAFKTNLVENTL